MLLSILDYYKVVNDLHLGAVNKRAIFMHFYFTHFPVDFDETCTYRSYDQNWHSDNQNEKGLLNQTSCVFNLFFSYLEKLKELRVYDKSLIVFKSDHGEIDICPCC